MNKDTIYRQAAIDAVTKALDRETLLNSFVRKVAVDAVKALPSAERRGRWMTLEYRYGTDGNPDTWVEGVARKGDFAYCSECKGKLLFDGAEDYVYSNYCPNCGAKMDEVE